MARSPPIGDGQHDGRRVACVVKDLLVARPQLRPGRNRLTGAGVVRVAGMGPGGRENPHAVPGDEPVGGRPQIERHVADAVRVLRDGSGHAAQEPVADIARDARGIDVAHADEDVVVREAER